MASLSDIVNVQIALNTAAVVRGTFGIPLIASPHASFAERVRVYTSMDAAEEDNLPPLLLTALSDSFSQTPRPRQIKVGRMSIDEIEIQPSVVTNNAVYSFKIDGTLITFTASSSATAANICTGLAAAAATAAVTGVTVTANSGVLEITYSGAVKPLTDFVKMEFGTITPAAAAGAVAADLTAINDEDSAWYGLVLTERTKARQLDAAEWTEARSKLFITATSEADVLNPSLDTDLISVLGDSQYFRTAVLYHTNAATEYPDAAWAARVFTIAPGGETWALKRLGSITPSNLTATQKQTIVNKGGNTFEFYQPQLALTNPGKTAAGEWIDIIRFRDYLADLIQTNMVQMMINRDKVPYTDAGIQLCANNLRKSLRTGQDVGGIAPDEVDADGNTVPGFVITAPLSSEVDDVTKASRVLNLSFVARIAGAIHVVEITGALAYSLD